MNITIDLPMLIGKAKQTSGMNLGAMAAEMHIHQPRISEWIKGRSDPSADQIAYLAEKAELPVWETLATLRPEWAEVWKKAANQMRSL